MLARVEKHANHTIEVKPSVQARLTISIVLRLASLAQDDPSIFRRNPERVPKPWPGPDSRGRETKSHIKPSMLLAAVPDARY